MKHALLLSVLSVLCYVGWSMADKKERALSTRFIARHGLRLGAFLLVIVALLALAYFVPSTVIF